MAAEGEPPAMDPGPASPRGHSGPPVWEGTLEPGDMLYIPRGLVHEAATTEAAPSMHLTITADTEERTVAWFLQHLSFSVSDDPPRGLDPKHAAALQRGEYAGAMQMAQEPGQSKIREALPVGMLRCDLQAIVPGLDR
jgi:hypothetical protein